jgi:hypothetical protein
MQQKGARESPERTFRNVLGNLPLSGRKDCLSKKMDKLLGKM